MNTSESLPRRIADVARSLQAETGSLDTMDLAVKLAVDVVGNAEDASISIVHRGKIGQTPASTSQRALDVDRIQYELGEGPLISEIWDEEVISIPDLATESRWGKWGPRAAKESGIGSMLCFRMFADKRRLGALSVYASAPHAFKGIDVDSGVALAAHTAIAIVVAREDENKEIALDSRSLIGQATGIMMERFGMDAVRAFAVLRRLSQDGNVQLHEIAAELIRTRHLPANVS